jgi:thiosulfate reductase cytochrome b subunit
MAHVNTFKMLVHWLFLTVTLLFVISGLGITEYGAVESITFGFLTKALAYQIHINLLIPFLLLLAVHIYLAVFSKKGKSRGKV